MPIFIEPDAHGWPGLPSLPVRPERPKSFASRESGTKAEGDARWAADRLAQNQWKAAEEEWRLASQAHSAAVRAHPKYREAAADFIERQKREPLEVPGTWGWWAYRGKVLVLNSDEPEPLPDKARDLLLLKHLVLRQERSYEKIRREVETLENMERLEGVPREPIPESVRLFVWQRDQGRCVKCESQERLEFDHVIPIALGGSNTERNIQLLCETCNRSKGANI